MAQKAHNKTSSPSYWSATREPRYALLLVVPVLATYEVGVVVLAHLRRGAPQVRNVAELYVQWVMRRFGLGGHLVSAGVVVAVLVCWQVLAGRGWRVRLGYLGAMLLESLFYALALLLSYRVVTVLEEALLAAGSKGADLLQGLVLGLGAGVYEEFLFRLLLMGCVCWLLRRAGAGRVSSAAVSALVAAVGFSAFHMLGEEGLEALRPQRFLFRTFAGLVFAGSFYLRGFGITTGTHALFNVIRVLLGALEAS